MGLATSVLTLLSFPLAESVDVASTAVRITGALGLLFTVANVIVLNLRARRADIKITRTNFVSAGVIDLLSIGASAFALGGTARWLEWMLVLLIARPMLAFVLVLSDISAESG